MFKIIYWNVNNYIFRRGFMKKTPLATITIIGLIGSLASIYALFYSGDFSQISDGNNSPVFNVSEKQSF